jgi:type VI secretion system protein ImpM
MSTMQLSPICFGKIPTFGDFVRHNAASKEVEVLDQWLQEGLIFAKNRLHPNLDLAYKKAPVYHFVFPSNQDTRSLIGLISPSFDKIGRKYPFLVAVAMDNALIHSNRAQLIPAVLGPFLGKATALVKEAVEGRINENLGEMVENLGSSIDLADDYYSSHYDEFKKSTDLTRFMDGLFGHFESMKKYQLFHNLNEFLRPLKGYDIRQLNYGLRFPLGKEAAQNVFEVAFWQEMIYQFFPTYSAVPYIFYSSDPSVYHAYLFLFFRLPSPNNFANLLQVDLENDQVYKLDAAGATDVNIIESKLSSGLKELLNQPDLDLSSFLQQFLLLE